MFVVTVATGGSNVLPTVELDQFYQIPNLHWPIVSARIGDAALLPKLLDLEPI
jgi:hypothetical protein